MQATEDRFREDERIRRQIDGGFRLRDYRMLLVADPARQVPTRYVDVRRCNASPSI